MKYEFEAGDTEPAGDCGMSEAGIHHETPEGEATNGIWYQRIICFGQNEAQADALRDRVLDALQDEGKLAKAEAILLAALNVMECEGTNGYDFVTDIYELLGKERCNDYIAEQIEKIGARSV